MFLKTLWQSPNRNEQRIKSSQKNQGFEARPELHGFQRKRTPVGLQNRQDPYRCWGHSVQNNHFRNTGRFQGCGNMSVSIYGLFENETGKCIYVGRTSNLSKRSVGHRARFGHQITTKVFRTSKSKSAPIIEGQIIRAFRRMGHAKFNKSQTQEVENKVRNMKRKQIIPISSEKEKSAAYRTAMNIGITITIRSKVLGMGYEVTRTK